MPKEVHHGLTPARVRQEKRPGRYADGNGLYLVVSDTGARWWQWRGTVHGRRRELGIGSARIISLADAREVAKQWRRIAREGGDPAAERDSSRRKPLSFEEAAQTVWREQIEPRGRSDKYRAQWLTTLEAYAFPLIGSRPVHTITQADVLRTLSPIWLQKPTTARLLRQRLRTVLNWARTAGHFDGINPVDGVEEGLPRQRSKVQHHRAIPYGDLPELMRRLSAMDDMSALAARFMVLTASRSGEVRHAVWSEIDRDARLWVIPPERMKAGEPHRVPLSDAALDVLSKVQGLSGNYLFPSLRTGRPMSDAALSRLFARLGVPGVPHGCRAAFRIWAAECSSAPREVAEMSLAHKVGDLVERSYARSDLLAKRRQLMDQWARFCLSGERAGQVVELRA